MNIYVPGKGPFHPKIVFLGEAPSYEEEIQLEPFVGPSGKFLRQLAKEAGIVINETWLTNVSKYMVPPNPKEGKKVPFKVRAQSVGIDIEQQLAELRSELVQLNPHIVIALGATALWAMTGKTKIQSFRGSIMSGMNGIKTIATYHPAHLLHQEGDVKGYWNKPVVVLDLQRAKRQSEFREIILPHRNLQIARSSADLYGFINDNQKETHLSVDIEAVNCMPACVGLAFNKHYGLTIPLWNENDLSTIPDSDMVSIWAMLSHLLADERIKKIGQNFNYDKDKLRRLGFLVSNTTEDTMLKAFATNPELPKNLAFNTSIYTEEPYYKDEGMYEGSMADLLMGCARDACVTKEISDAMDPYLDEMGLRPYYNNFLIPLYSLYGKIESVGFAVDENIREQLIRKYVEWDERLRYRLFQLSGGEYVNTASPKQVAELLYDKWKVSLRQGTGEEVLTQLLNGAVKNEAQRIGIETILEDRRVKKTIGTYLLSPTDFDGRMRTSYFICLETGRSSTNQQEPPIRPTIETKDEHGKKKKQAVGMAFQTITKHGDIGADVRTMLVADEGYVILQADSSQAEARVIFLLARDEQALKDIDEHDYHALTASWFFGGVESDYSKKVLGYESPIRFAGKTLRHSCHLGSGKRRAATEINTQARKYKIDYRITEAFADQAIKIFHAKQPSIKRVFQNDVIKCLEKNRTLIAPVPYGIDAPIGGTRVFFERWNDELFRQAFSYLPQRTVSENTKRAALATDKRSGGEIRIAVESHDALAALVKIKYEQEAAQIMKEEFEKPIDFSNCSLSRGTLVIPCEIERGFNYKDLSKFKWMVPA